MQSRRRDTSQNFELIGGEERVPIVLVPYDPAWPQRFEAERERINNALGESAVRVEHIGSTAVPDLSAKPVIDVQVSVDDVEDEGQYVPPLESAGYVLRVREPEHRMLRTPTCDVHVHICNSGSDWERRHILFRDWLRESKSDRALYESTKRELAKREWATTNHYADAKSTVIAEIMVRATDGSLVASDRELLTAVRDARRRLAEVGPEHTRADGDFESVSLPIEDCNALRDLLLAEDARVVVEIGLAYGSSALAIEEALLSKGQQDTKHVIIDAYQHRFQNAGWDAITTAGVGGRCTLLTERSQLALPRLAADNFVADAAFVDGSHVFHNVFVDLYFLGEVIRPGGLIILDDSELPSVATAARYFEFNTEWRPHLFDAPTRLRAFRLPKPRVEPSFETFKPFASDSNS